MSRRFYGTTIISKVKSSIKRKTSDIISLADRLEFMSQRASVFKQGIISLILASLGSLLGGIYLGSFSEMLKLLPGLVIMIPPAIGMRGNIFACLGSRLSTALHMGEVSTLERSPVISGNIAASIFLTIIVSFFLGILSRFTAFLCGFVSISVIDLVVVSVMGGLISSIFILFITILVAFQSFSRGWDPDNVTAPLITSVGDLITLPCLFLAVKFLIWKNGLFGIIVVICAVCGMYIIKNKPKITYSIVKDSFFILMGSASLSIGSGLLINYRINQFIAMSGLFILLPPFLEGGGALGGILSSRLSTSLHLGMIESTWKPTREAVEDFLVVVLLGITLFPFIGGLAYMASTMLGLQFPPVYQVMKACFYAGLLIAVVVNFLSYYAAVASTRFGLDPDSVVIPMISGFMDFLGTNCLLIVLIALEIA